jgi:aspartyl aminopeptidase
MIYFDKEEIGSTNGTGADSNFIVRLVSQILKKYDRLDLVSDLLGLIEKSKART